VEIAEISLAHPAELAKPRARDCTAKFVTITRQAESVNNKVIHVQIDEMDICPTGAVMIDEVGNAIPATSHRIDQRLRLARLLLGPMRLKFAGVLNG